MITACGRMVPLFLLGIFMLIPGIPVANAENISDTQEMVNDTISDTNQMVNVSGVSFNADEYTLPPLHFDPDQPKVVINSAINAVSEDSGSIQRTRVTMAQTTAESASIPLGAIIYHSRDRVTTVFDNTGEQLFSAEDSEAGLIPTSEGQLPATEVHELPSGSNIKATENMTYVIHDNVLLFVEIHESNDLQQVDDSSSASSIFSRSATTGLSAMPALVTDPFNASELAYARCMPNPPFSGGSVFSAKWTVPTSPHSVKPLSPMYITTGVNTVDTEMIGGRKWMTAKNVLEYDYNTSAWSYYPCYYYALEIQDGWYYYFSRKPAQTGDKFLGSIKLVKITNPSPYPSYYSYHFSMKDLSTGGLTEFGFSTEIGTIFHAEEMNLFLKGDERNLTEDTVIGDTVFTEVAFPYAPNYTYASPTSRLPHLNIENQWPDHISFRTLNGPIHVYPKMIVQVVDPGTGLLINNTNVGLYDYNVSQWQNLTAQPGTTVFNSSGSVHQYLLVPDRVYRLAASAAGYEPVLQNITFADDGQEVTVNLTKVQEPWMYTFSMTNTATRTDENATKGELMTPAINDCDMMQQKLESRGWKMKFNNQGPNVTKADFCVNPESGHITLNSAVLHFHVGHGLPLDNTGHTTLVLLDQNNDAYPLNASEVEGKWGGNNKWVVLDSCYALQDHDWAKALDTTHGIMGFKTQADVHPKFTEKFLHYAIDGNNTVYDSFRWTTYDLYKDTKVPKFVENRTQNETMVAAVIFNDINQAKYDYLPGVKSGIYPDTNSENYYRKDWLCNQTPMEAV